MWYTYFMQKKFLYLVAFDNENLYKGILGRKFDQNLWSMILRTIVQNKLIFLEDEGE